MRNTWTDPTTPTARTYRLVLEYTAPARWSTDPNEWDWMSVLDMIAPEDDEQVRVISITPTEEV